MSKKKEARVFIAEPLPEFLGGKRVSEKEVSMEVQAYGKLQRLSPVTLNPIDMETSARILSARMDELQFDPENDYIALTGRILMQIVMVAVAKRKYPSIKLLVFMFGANGTFRPTVLSDNFLQQKGGD